jgi:hypothetical protein
MKAGGRFAYRKLAEFTYNNLFSAMIGRVPYSGPYKPEPTRFEKVIQAPGLSATLGRWVRTSSGFDEEAKLINDQVDRPRAMARLTVQQAVKRKMAQGEWDPDQLAAITTSPYALEYLARYVTEYNLRQSLPPELQRLVMAPNDESRAALLQGPQ